MTTEKGRSRSLWRHPERGKHHIAPDQQETLCGRLVPGFWQTEGVVQWADEDLCAICARRSDDAS